jgi:2-keto-3-deoxy-L-rhamnonate aldolase RhmA
LAKSTKSLRRRVLAGESVRGTMLFESFSPGVAQIMKLAGCEYILYDMEHTGIGLETIKEQVAMCRGLGVAPMVRVPRGEYHFIARALDIGCHGVMVPMVNTADEARTVVEAMRYPPTGRRGAAFGFAHDDYEPGDPLAKMKAANARNLAIVQIETEHGLANVEEIAAVPGVDVLWLGHFDLTNFLGIPGEFDNPIYKKAVKRIAAAGHKHKKGLGFMAADPVVAKSMRRSGYNMIASGTDMGILMKGTAEIISAVK